MPSLLPSYEYDIFISYRQKDNKGDRWVTEFVTALKAELEATFKEDISIYFDENPHDGLLETHDVDKSLESKLKCLIFIPIISQTYCDPKAFAWQHEFCAFNKLAREDHFGRDVKLSNGNVASRILPIKIHDLDSEDKALLENEMGGVLRAIEFIYREPGVNRPLRAKDDNTIKDTRQHFYRDHVNKVANAIKEILAGLRPRSDKETKPAEFEPAGGAMIRFMAEIKRRSVVQAGLVSLIVSLLIWKITSLLVYSLSAPKNLLTFVTILLVISFPVSIILAWLFERSPSGFVRYGSAAALNNPFSAYQRKPLTGNAAILMLLLAVVAVNFFFSNSNQSTDAGQSVHTLKLNIVLEDVPASIAISPDGLKIVYSLERNLGEPLLLRNLDESFSTELNGTEEAGNPFFSPDGTMIGFFKLGSIYTTSLRNSQPSKIAEAANAVRGAYWTKEDTIIFSAEIGTGLNKVSIAGGDVLPIPIPGQNFSRPVPLAGTDFILGCDENWDVLLLSTANSGNKVLMRNGGWKPMYIEPGYLLYVIPGALLAAPFDKQSMQITGPSVPAVTNLNTNGLSYDGLYDVSKNGTLIYSSAPAQDKARFVWVDHNGKVVDSLALPPNFYGAFSLSPDGARLAYGINGPQSHIWIFDLKTGQNQKITSEGVNQYPVWSPDGSWVTYSSLLNGKWELYRQNLNSTSEREKLTTTGSVKRSGTWSPDGKLLSFYQDVTGQSSNTFLLSLDDKKITSPWHNTHKGEFQPRFSPDGRYVCYYSSTTGAPETYVEPFPPTGERWQISNGGVDAVWASDGSAIFYRTAAGSGTPHFYMVKVSATKGFTFAPPQLMFAGPFIDVFDKSFNVSPDSKRFLVLKTDNTQEKIRHFEVVLNWVEELERIMKKK